jgi:glycine/D-amino acid oxidase-like deaminating enzyme
VKEYAYWLDTLEPSSAGLARQEPVASAIRDSQSVMPLTRVDVAIVGAGYTGLSAARTLARAGATVVVIERERIGWGASSRNGGQVLTGLKLGPSTLVRRFGERRARSLFDVATASIARLETLVAEEAIDCELARSGHLEAAWKPSHFEDFRDEQALLARAFGHRVHLLSRAEQRSEIDSRAYHGVMVDEASRAINPAKYVHGLAAAVRRAGVTIVEGIAVTNVSRQSSGPSRAGRAGIGARWRVATRSGEVEARDVLIATNGYTNGAFPPLQRRLIPIGSYIIATEPLVAGQSEALLPRRRMAFDSKNFLYYFRVTSDGRLLFGGRAEFGRPDAETTRRAAAILHDGMVRVFPALAGTRIEYAWGGNVAFTRDQMPRAGLLDGVYYAGGYAGHGVAMATHLGEQIARRMAGEPLAHPMFDDNCPAIPMYSGRPWFLPLVGAYYRVKDWLQ